MKKLMTLILALTLLCQFALVAHAAETSGICGVNVNWSFDASSGVLTISGNGQMDDWELFSTPWFSHRLKIKEVIIESGVTSVGNYAFATCTNLAKVTIPTGVDYIGDDAFQDCKSLKTAELPAGVTYLGGNAFLGCRKLETMVLPMGLTRIRRGAFSSCDSLTAVTIPASVIAIDITAFSGCKSLKELVIPQGVKTISQAMCSGCTALTRVSIPDSVTEIESYAFRDCNNLTDAKIPNGVKTIGISAFEGCTSLPEVVIPGSVTELGMSAFSGCRFVEKLVIPNSITKIETHVFEGCSRLTNVVIPDGITALKSGAFRDCTALTEVTIPVSVKEIGMNVFYGCNRLTDVYYAGSEAQWNKIIISDFGNECLTEATIHFNAEPTPIEFSDVQPSDYFYAAVQWAVQNGVTNGVGNGCFAPEENCTRGQIVTFLWRAMGEPEPTSTANPFTDVKQGEYYYKAVLWAVENGITTGSSKTTFEPNATCTRAQSVTFLYRTAGAPKVDGTCKFSDVPSNAYFYQAVIWAGQNGITNGVSEKSFAPNDTCTRAQIVSFLYRHFNH